MSVIVIRDGDRDWCEPPEDWAGKAKPGEPSLAFKRLLPGGPGQPNMQRTRYEPNHFEPPHSHAEDEVIYVLAGVIHFGDQNLGFGDAIYVPRDTRYSLRAGAEGAEFVRVGLPV
jgi:quercetin dioxygenase-like cupin family protein